MIGCLFALMLLGACNTRHTLDPAVGELTFHTLSGEQITLSEQGGPTLINFWSTSCVICVREMPDMAELYNQYQPRGFQLIAVAMPYDAPNTVVELARDKRLPFPVALDLHGEAVAAFASVKGTPTSYLLDAQGNLVSRHVGAINMNELRANLDKLLDLS